MKNLEYKVWWWSGPETRSWHLAWRFHCKICWSGHNRPISDSRLRCRIWCRPIPIVPEFWKRTGKCRLKVSPVLCWKKCLKLKIEAFTLKMKFGCETRGFDEIKWILLKIYRILKKLSNFKKVPNFVKKYWILLKVQNFKKVPNFHRFDESKKQRQKKKQKKHNIFSNKLNFANKYKKI